MSGTEETAAHYRVLSLFPDKDINDIDCGQDHAETGPDAQIRIAPRVCKSDQCAEQKQNDTGDGAALFPAVPGCNHHDPAGEQHDRDDKARAAADLAALGQGVPHTCSAGLEQDQNGKNDT